jgi:thiol-disulfide isomerase/thioredoxin
MAACSQACQSGRVNTTGLLVAVAVLVLATGVGLWRRRTDGRLRPVGAPRPDRAGAAPTGLAPAGAAPVVTAPASAESADGSAPDDRVGAGPDRPVQTPTVDSGAAGERLDPALLAELGVQPAQATLLQFSSAFCAPCRAVRRISGEVADMIPGVQHVEVDAESHLEAVRTLGIWRTPTLLVLDADGRVVRRATGVPGKAQLIAVLGDTLPPR